MDADRGTYSQLAHSHIRGGLQRSVTLDMNKVSEAQKASSCRLPLPSLPKPSLKMLIHHSTVASRLL